MENRADILLVEDELPFRTLMKLILSEAGYNVTETDGALGALEILDHSFKTGISFDLLITDIQMPGMSGIELMEEMYARGIIIPVLIMTSYNSTEIKCITGHSERELDSELLFNNKTEIIEKPHSHKILLKYVENILADSEDKTSIQLDIV